MASMLAVLLELYMHCHLQQGRFVCHVNYFWSE